MDSTQTFPDLGFPDTVFGEIVRMTLNRLHTDLASHKTILTLDNAEQPHIMARIRQLALPTHRLAVLGTMSIWSCGSAAGI